MARKANEALLQRNANKELVDEIERLQVEKEKEMSVKEQQIVQKSKELEVMKAF